MVTPVISKEDNDILRLEKKYISNLDWEKHENANHNISYSNFRNYIFEKLVETPEVLKAYLPPVAVEQHFRGDLHIHKLPDSLWIPYCAGWSFKKILQLGLKTPTIVSKPAKHLDTAVAHLTNFFFMGAQEWTGAQAVSAFDLYAAPFVNNDALDFTRVKQILQGMLFELNYPARSGYQSPFTNITLVIDTSKDMLEGEAFVGGAKRGSLGDYVDEAIELDKALFQLYAEGDAVGQPFTFPIPTLMLTKNFDWNNRRWGGLTDTIFETLARKGSAYLLNGYSSNVEALYAMCLHGNEKITIRNDGEIHLLTMNELVTKYAGEVEASDPDGAVWYRVGKPFEVFSYDPETGSVSWRPVKRILMKKAKSAVRITLTDGRSFVVTHDHPLLVYRSDIKKHELITAGKLLNLKGRNVFKVPVLLTGVDGGYVKIKGEMELNIDEEFAYFLGLYYGDGTLIRHTNDTRYSEEVKRDGSYLSGVQFSINKDEKEIRGFIVSYALKMGWSMREWDDPRYPSVHYIAVYSAPLARTLYDNGVSPYSDKKRVPWFIVSSPPSVRLSFIKGLLDSDGYFRLNSMNKERGQWELHIKNRELAEDVLLLASLCGISAYIRENKDSSLVVYFPATVNKEFNTDAHKHHYRTGDVVWVSIHKVEEVEFGEEETFVDVEVDGVHYFVHSLGVITHNCCRLTIDVNHVVNHANGKVFSLKMSKADIEDAYERFLKSRENTRTYGIWALPDATGSIGVVTLNLPRLAHLSRGEWSVFDELLASLMENARKVLLTWRQRYGESLRAGLMPLTEIYLGHLQHHFNTIGVIGLPEASANFMRNPKLWFEGSNREMEEAISIEKRMVSKIRRIAEEFEEKDGYLYNVEEVPGESTGYKLAKADIELFKEEYRNGEILVPSDGIAPFYSNSIVPYYADVPIFQRAIWEGEVQKEFTGGVMMHLFLHEQPDPKALKNLVYRIATNTKVVYFSITPTITVCKKCGKSTTGYVDACPSCGSSEVEHWSRIVGYYRPVSNWNPGKKAEFKLRVTY